MASNEDASNFDASLGCLFASDLDRLAAQLESVAGLQACESAAIVAATHETLLSVLHAKLCRLLILELNAARVTGQLSAEDPAERWNEFVIRSSSHEFWRALDEPYPTVGARVRKIVENRCAAALELGWRFAQDRDELAGLGFRATLQSLRYGAGDSHCGGRTVAILTGADGSRIAYKPRPVEVDAKLRAFVMQLVEMTPVATTVQVPRVLDRGTHGWAEFIEHRYATESELPRFYRGIGHWLAIMRLLGGSDLHAENLIAHGACPVVIDCETLFTPNVAPVVSGLGDAPDRASRLLGRSVLTVGLLPGRGLGLGWRGVDSSALGMLPGQQPTLARLSIVRGGTDEARIGTTLVEIGAAQNHPSPDPALAAWWPQVIEGFDELIEVLQGLDREGALEVVLADFADCRIRVVPRATEVYAELARMLWHPVSLHRVDEARERARGLMARMAANVAMAPSDPAVIEAEIEDLLVGDVPYFSTRVCDGQLDGPGGTRWLPAQHLAQAALRDWRDIDFATDRKIVRASLVSAYLNDGWTPGSSSLLPDVVRSGDTDRRRRAQAADILRRILAEAIHADDGTVTWIAPTLNPTGWSVQPLESDLYNGLSGIALLAGAYVEEMEQGRADAIAGVDRLRDACLRTLERSEHKLLGHIARGSKMRPPQVGGYIGLGSQIWALLALARLMGDPRLVDRAVALAELVPSAVAADEVHDVLSGAAGAIVPLLRLSEETGDSRFTDMARALGDRLQQVARRDGGKAVWPAAQWPNGVGGFAHGATGIGWALTLLARSTEDAGYAQMASEAFAYEAALFDPAEGNWLDMRNNPDEVPPEARTAAAWCHGAVGIGLARLDLDPNCTRADTREALQAAAAATWRKGFGWNHTACHGDLGAWELVRYACELGVGPAGVDEAHVCDLILTSLEMHGACSGFVRQTLTPGLLPGVGGIAYQLLRMHPDSTLPSVLLPGGMPERRG